MDAIINVVSAPKLTKDKLSIGDESIFDRYELVRDSELQSSLLLTHLASKFLAPNGFVGFNGGA